MNVIDLVESVDRSEGVLFRGHARSELRGLALRVERALPQGQYVVLVDHSWGKRALRRYGPSGDDLDQHVRKAHEAGAAGFLCSTEIGEHPALQGANVITAGSTLHAAFRIAEVIRDRRGVRITAVTGSAGKSTTKAMLTHALNATSHLSVQSPPHGQNIFPSLISHYSRLGDADYSVLEVAGSCFQPFRRHSFSLAADVSIVTSITEAHVDYLGGLREIAKRKAEIFNGTTPGGTAIINADTPHSDILVQRAIEEGRQLVTYGETEGVTVRLVDYDPLTGTVEAHAGGETMTYSLGAKGRHMAMNSLAVLATLRTYKIPEWRTMLESLATFRPLPGRGEETPIRIREGTEVRLIDEAYNANPASMKASLQTLQEAHPQARKIAVLGDMLELGESTQDLHNSLAESIQQFPPDVLHLYGPQMAELASNLALFRGEHHHWYDMENLVTALKRNLHDGDAVLIKSSRGTGLHEAVSRLTRSASGSHI